MAEITAKMVKDLRDLTGAGMMDCKKALGATNGDMDAAVEELRKNGLAKAAKKAGRVAAEGLVAIKVSDDCKTAAMVEVNSETDFCAKGEKFVSYVDSVAKQALATDAADMDAFMNEAWLEDPTQTVKDVLVQKVSVISENLQIRRFVKMNTTGYLGYYLHHDDRKCALIEIECANVTDEVKAMVRNLGMQIVSLRPEFLNDSEVPAEFKAKETEIILENARQDESFAKKPEMVQNKIVEGRLQKELKEICLMDQPFFMDAEGKSVEAYVKSVAKEAGCDIAVKRFVRYEVGEGIEKKEENFADEVAKQMGK